MQLEVCCGWGLVKGCSPLFIDVNSLGMTFSPSVFLRQVSVCSPARSRVSPGVFSLILSPQGAAKDVRIWAECDASASSGPTKPAAVAEGTPRRDPLGFSMEFLPFPTEPSWLVVVKLSVGISKVSSRGRSRVWHQFCYSVMSGLVHPGFTGDHSPLEGKGRAGWGRWGWQHSHRCSTSLQRAPWNTRCYPQQGPLA